MGGLLDQRGGQGGSKRTPVVEGHVGERLGGVEVLGERDRHARGPELVDETGQGG